MDPCYLHREKVKNVVYIFTPSSLLSFAIPILNGWSGKYYTYSVFNDKKYVK